VGRAAPFRATVSRAPGSPGKAGRKWGTSHPAAAPPGRAWRGRPTTLWLAWCILAGCQGCGYNVGAPFNPEVRTISVNIAQSDSNRRWLEYQLTEAVQRQIQQRSHFRLAKEGYADTRLDLHIVDLRKSVLGQTRNSDPRELQMNLQVDAVWQDVRSGEILRQQNIEIPSGVTRLAAQAEFAPEVGQSLATADREVINRLARNIVDMLEMPW